MNKIYTIEEIQKIEQHEFKRLKSSFILMNRAGTNCAKKIHKIYPKKNIIVLCGPGNNGGDGLVISRILKKLKHEVTLYCLKSESYKGDAKKAYTMNNLVKNDFNEFKINNKSIIIDCLFGIGLSRKISGIYKKIIKFDDLEDKEHFADVIINYNPKNISSLKYDFSRNKKDKCNFLINPKYNIIDCLTASNFYSNISDN